MRAAVVGLGWVTAAGIGPGRQAEGFAMPPGPLPKLRRKDIFAEPDMRFGRLDDFSRVGLAAIAFALRDAGVPEDGEARAIGLVAATRFGCLATDSEYFDTAIPEGGRLASPNLFAYTLPSSFLGEAAIRFGLMGASFAVNESPPAGGVSALRLALETLALGDEGMVLAGLCDLPRPEWLPGDDASTAGAVFAALATAPAQVPAPYGWLGLGEEGEVTFEGGEVAGMAELTCACLKRWQRKCP